LLRIESLVEPARWRELKLVLALVKPRISKDVQAKLRSLGALE
jgi:hypothetical protein